jgi:hypothetical protein
MHVGAGAVVEAGEHGEGAAGVDGHALDAIAHLREDLRDRRWIPRQVREEDRVEPALAGAAGAVGDDEAVAVRREPEGERSVPVGQTSLAS